jgi:hypothetical protein
MSIWQVLIQLIAAGMVVSIVCRAVKMNAQTREPVRWALMSQGGAAFALAVIPFGRPHWLPWLIAGYMAAGLVVQMVTARYWSRGQPKQFER